MVRPVIFMFYTVESMLSMLLMYFHIRGFLTQPLDFLPIWKQINHYFYSASFYLFTVITLCSSINICTGHNVSISEEVIRSLSGFILHTVISLMTLENAERDFHMMYIMSLKNVGVEKPVHPFIEYMRAQAICALITGVAYLLHAILAIDVLLSGSESDEDNLDDDADYAPVRLYIFGEMIQSRLEKYEWFNEFSRGQQMPI
ncbi:uncharacterized protein LOC132785472 [Drosophila nasuta]|uniref:uncharacterized protein LOC132785472 n=1 Tax=Drosophila nasuta TaxID=42062 RepID=UPI00295ED5BB|nr:uncharacterized protein LOC132785472 [Drosophila nasuta]